MGIFKKITLIFFIYLEYSSVLERTVLRGLVFGTLFSPHFGDQRTSFFSKETMLKPMSGLTRQVQQKLRLNLAYNITNLRKKLPKAQTSVKSNVTSQNKNLENKLRHDKALGGIESYGFMYGEAWARPQNLSFCTWRGLSEAGEAHHIVRIRL